MKQLTRLSNEEFEAVWKIMEESFPTDERRNEAGQRRILEKENYHLYGCMDKGKTAAFFSVWEFEYFSFIEHFAVEKSCRNGGIGGKLLRELLDEIKKPVVLEVEPQETALAARRIGFYERNGFALNPYEYTQPAMSAEGKAIPLLIMSYPAKLKKEEFDGIRKELYRQVYEVSPL